MKFSDSDHREVYVLVSTDNSIQAHYEAMRRNGIGHNLAEMFALQSPPGMTGTDSVFNEGRCNGNQFEKYPWMGDAYAQGAKEAGVNTKGKTYLGGLARFPGDPEAWVSDRSDVKAVCAKRGWNCRGSVNFRGEAFIPDDGHKDVAIADDIIDDKVTSIIERQVPEADRSRVDTNDLRAQVKDKMTPHWAKK